MRLKKGDSVDVIASASFPKDQSWKKGISILESWGLKVNFSSQALRPWIFHSHTNKKRFEYLKKAFQNPSSQAVWSLRGGYGSQKLMPSLQKIKIKKKLFIGFSDVTVFHLYLNGICKIPSLHGPSICDLPYLSQKELLSLKKVLFGEEDFIYFKNLKSFKNSKIKTLNAPLVGGNLTLLQTSIGTPWFPSLKSHILFLEDVNELGYRVDRALHQLYFSGALKGVKALIFGSINPIKSSEFQKVLESFSKVLDIPLFFHLPCGHKSPHLSLPLGTQAKITQISSNKFDLKIKNL